MKFQAVDTPLAAARFVAGLIADLVAARPNAAIALPTGKTPLPLYDYLSKLMAGGIVDCSRAHWFALDEFLGPNIPSESTFRHFLERHFLQKAGISSSRLHAMDPGCPDPVAEAARYESEIKAHGGLSLAILGIGHNGHIAFNEPGTPLDSRTGLRTLARRTREANRYLFAGPCPVPGEALTMGIGTIMEAEMVVLMATGQSKAELMSRLRTDEVSAILPASALKLHPDCTVVLDAAAASLMV